MTGSWRPAPATKPAHLSSSSAPSAQTLAALQGATSAFAHTSHDRPNNVKAQHTGPSSPPTMSPTDQPARGRQFANTVQNNEGRSPSRGRHLDLKNAYLAGARAATSNASSRARAPHPTTLDRSPSSIAARLASSSSSSPARSSPGTSPRRTATFSPDRGLPLREPSTKKEVFAIKERVTSQGVPPVQPQPTLSSAKDVALDFGRVPTLSSPQTAQRSNITKQVLKRAQDVVTAPNSPLNAAHEDAAVPRSMRAVTRRRNSSAPSEPSQPLPLSSNTPKSPSNQSFNNPGPRPSNTMPEMHHALRSKPTLPPPRKTHTSHIRGPIEPNRTGPLPGETREQAISRMADAMVAGSLASIRSPSPLKGNAMASVKVSRRSHSATDLRRAARPFTQSTPLDTYQHMSSGQQRSQRPMKQTLRKQASDKEDEDSAFEPTKRGRRHLVRKHPNMHHEGDRKRWRDKVTEAERKRYEGVFAANRGLLLKSANARASPSKMVDPESDNNKVVNIVVRDIWERSRLSKDALSDVYGLVAPGEPTSLNREQFVVGLWLIDQKLKGRKLPVTVSPSVWASVRHSTGIKIK